MLPSLKNKSLSCSYTTSSNNVYLYWYRQQSNRALEYIQYNEASSWSSYSQTADFAKGRFTSTAASSSTTITISKLALSDTAIYHCHEQRPAQLPAESTQCESIEPS
ncbi:UNVERIFIED_CONTAM: hypothetical protein FKN15_018543 [Acipenser sinensis]